MCVIVKRGSNEPIATTATTINHLCIYASISEKTTANNNEPNIFKYVCNALLIQYSTYVHKYVCIYV